MTDKERFEAAVAYAIKLVNGSVDGLSVADRFDILEDEFLRAGREGRGMDRHEVRRCIEAILRVAKFPKNDLPGTRLFRYRPRGRGQPRASINKVGSMAFAVGAVIGRFGLKHYRNDATESEHTALDAIAEAMRRLGKEPASYKGVDTALRKYNEAHDDRDAELEAGRTFGTADRPAEANG